MCVCNSHRSSPCSTARSPSPGLRRLVRARMPVGTNGLCKPASLTTRRRLTGALEDSCIRCTLSWMTPSHIFHDILHVYCAQSHMSIGVIPCTTSQPPSVGMTSQCPTIYTHASSYTAGLQVPTVSSSITGNLHPTPCIEWMQVKRGDPGCMAKVSTAASLSVHGMCGCSHIPYCISVSSM